MCSLTKQVYLLGGSTHKNKVLTNVAEWDPVSDTWSLLLLLFFCYCYFLRVEKHIYDAWSLVFLFLFYSFVIHDCYYYWCC